MNLAYYLQFYFAVYSWFDVMMRGLERTNKCLDMHFIALSDSLKLFLPEILKILQKDLGC